MNKERMTAEGTSSFEEFTDTIHRLLQEVYGKEVTFSEEYPSDADPDKHFTPYITYSLARRTVTEGRGVKQSVFSASPDPDYEGETITPTRKWFDCQVLFSVYAGTNRESRRWAEEFEDFIDRYKGLIKNEGVSEILFKEERKDAIPDTYRQNLSVRTLEYYLRIERIVEIKSVEIKRIEAAIEVPGQQETIKETYLVAKKENQGDPSRRVPIGDNSFLELYKQTQSELPKKEEQ